jgi:hypothetical protein
MSFYKKITKNVDIVLSISVLIIICVFVYKNSREYAEGDSEEKPGCEYPDDLWVEEKDGECVVGYDDLTIIPCEPIEESGNDLGLKDNNGFRISKNKSSTPESCPTKIRQDRCTHTKKCPVDCVGSWSKWGKCIEKPCGEQPSESRFYTVSTGHRFGGKPCKFKGGQEQKRKCSEIVKCDA